jgi:hypothetical protein
MNTNVQIYKKIGSLVFYKYEHAHAISFKCTGLVESQEIDYSFLYGIMNNNNLSQLSNISILNDNMCLIIDDKSCCSNYLYYNHIVRHIFINGGTFYANDVYTLSDYIIKFPFNLILANRMLSTIYLQHQLLLESGYSISYVDPEDILVICSQEEGRDDGILFFFSNYEKIYKINMTIEGGNSDSNDSIQVFHFYEHDNLFLPPELIENIDIPFTCHKSSWFYSLACVVLYCLNPDKINDGFRILCNSCESSNSKHDYMINQLSEYNGTKLYYTLLYCLSKEPCNREFILF